MARIPRELTVFPGHRVHKIWRGHNKERNIESIGEKLKYLELMNEELEREGKPSGAQIQALTLMSNHVHEILDVLAPRPFSDFMRRHHGRYGAYFNRRHKRSGKVAEDRPRTCLLEAEVNEMRAVFYVHANPLVANMVKKADHYRWSTHRLYAYGLREEWMKNISFPKWYLDLGKNPEARQKKYRKLFDAYLKEYGIIRQSFLRQLFLGSPVWVLEKKEEIQKYRKNRSPP